MGYRRRLWRWALIGSAVVLAVPLVPAGVVGVMWARADLDTVGEVAFERPLAIPPLAAGRVEDGRRVFDLRTTAGTTDFGVGEGATRTLGFNGSYLGPTLRAARGEEIQVNVTNQMDEPTTVHWHGHHLPAAADGGPHQPIGPGRTWSPRWRVDQPAATTWYHPHPHGATADHVYRGLAGMFILDDEQTDGLALPSEYGVDDIPVVVQDKAFDSGGQLAEREPAITPVGTLGDTVLANGTIGSYFEVTTALVRLRLLNAAGARVFDFGFHDDRAFTLIGTDGGLLPAPYRTDRIRLSPGERAEIVVAMRPGERADLYSYPPVLGSDFLNERFAGGDDRFPVLQLRAAGRLATSPPVPERLAAAPELDPARSGVTRQFRLGGSSINGAEVDLRRIDEVVEVGTVEVWEISSVGAMPHNFHVHGVRFRVVEVAGTPPGPELSGWKDTVYIAPDTTVRIVLRFAGHTDPDLPYLYHCHVLQHEDRGMMGQFVVVEPGQPAGRPPAHDH